MLEAAQPLMWDQPKREQPWYEKQPYSPANLMLDIANKAAGVISDPLFAIARGDLHRAAAGYVPGRQSDMDAGLARQSFDATGAAVAGSAFAKNAAAPARQSVKESSAQHLPNRVYHYGTVPEGGRFDPSKSAYDGDVFVSSSPKMAVNSANNKGSIHELTIDPAARIFDYENPAHVDDAMAWWRSQFGGRKEQINNAETIARSELQQGLFHRMEPSNYKSSHTVNPFIRDNFDGYFMKEYGSQESKNLGIHKQNSLLNLDGSTFYANPFAGAVPVTVNNDDQRRKREQRK